MPETAHDAMAQLRQFAGEPAGFWPLCAGALGLEAGAAVGFLAVRDPAGGWRQVCAWPDASQLLAGGKGFLQAAMDAAPACMQAGSQILDLGAVPGTGGLRSIALLQRLWTGQDQDLCLAAFLLQGVSADKGQVAAGRLRLLAHTPADYQQRRIAAQARQDVARFAAVLDLVTLLNAETRFGGAAMRFCNELVPRFRCDRISLGWRREEYVRLLAMSHTEKFEKRMDAVRQLETAMEETLDQDEELLWPLPEGSGAVCRDHEAFSREQGSPYLCSLPLRTDGEVVAVLMCERHTAPFSASETGQLRLYCDQAVRRLADLKRTDCWFGRRWAIVAKEKLGRLVGVEHTWPKTVGVVCAILLVVLLFGRGEYRVEAPFVLRAEDLAHLPAPFDGYIALAHVKVGDAVRRDLLLVTLDTQELLLDEASALADRQRYLREGEKARAENALADMRIAEAMATQAQVRLEQVRWRLSQASIKAPLDGVVAEGDLRERIGAPVRQGDVLLKVARLDKLYAEIEIPEAEVQAVKSGVPGELAFASQPAEKFGVTVERVEPVAQTRAGKNCFMGRAVFSEGARGWYRPGMSGIAKVNAGRRNLLWIYTHKTVDWLRLRLWW